jgi:tetratricopeptide (TPR) repeat protein
LFRIVESPRYAKLAYAPEYANAELTLGRALVRAGGYASAERYLLRALGRGPKSSFFAPAYRAMVDIALETREQAAILAMLDRLGADLQARGLGDLPRDSRAEHAYLAGKVAYEKGDLASAEAQFQQVDRQSRFYAAALYFRGLAHARKGHFAAARRSLCEIVEQVDQSRFTFFIDGRYFAIKDLAYLAASLTSRASTTTRTTSTSACPRTRSACRTPSSRRHGRCSRRASTRPRPRSSSSSIARSPSRRWRPTCCCCTR